MSNPTQYYSFHVILQQDMTKISYDLCFINMSIAGTKG